jgi:hypothetical protein
MFYWKGMILRTRYIGYMRNEPHGYTYTCYVFLMLLKVNTGGILRFSKVRLMLVRS